MLLDYTQGKILKNLYNWKQQHETNLFHRIKLAVLSNQDLNSAVSKEFLFNNQTSNAYNNHHNNVGDFLTSLYYSSMGKVGKRFELLWWLFSALVCGSFFGSGFQSGNINLFHFHQERKFERSPFYYFSALAIIKYLKNLSN